MPLLHFAFTDSYRVFYIWYPASASAAKRFVAQMENGWCAFAFPVIMASIWSEGFFCILLSNVTKAGKTHKVKGEQWEINIIYQVGKNLRTAFKSMPTSTCKTTSIQCAKPFQLYYTLFNCSLRAREKKGWSFIRQRPTTSPLVSQKTAKFSLKCVKRHYESSVV